MKDNSNSKGIIEALQTIPEYCTISLSDLRLDKVSNGVYYTVTTDSNLFTHEFALKLFNYLPELDILGVYNSIADGSPIILVFMFNVSLVSSKYLCNSFRYSYISNSNIYEKSKRKTILDFDNTRGSQVLDIHIVRKEGELVGLF